jgi:D-sedoheptulose 7-phosphate isomerase
VDKIEKISLDIFESGSLLTSLSKDPHYSAIISDVSEAFVSALAAGGKLMFAGNGGSAAESQHMAAEYVNRFRFDRAPMAAIALSTDTSNLTSISNDYDFADVFARQLRALGKSGDVFVAYSTSGTSANILKALGVAKELGIVSVFFVGDRGSVPDEVAKMVVHIIDAGTRITAKAQEVHLCVGHIIAGLVEEAMFGSE